MPRTMNSMTVKQELASYVQNMHEYQNNWKGISK